MKVLATKGQAFATELYLFFRNVASMISWFKMCWSFFLGMSAKLSLMVSFLVIVKLTSSYVLGDDNILSSSYMGAFLALFIPISLFLSGSSLYFDMRFKIKYEHQFVRTVRELNLQHFLAEHDELDEALLFSFIEDDEQGFFRGAVDAFHALFELLQSILITIVIVSYLLYADWFIALLLLLVMAMVVPVFVYLGNKKQTGISGNAEKGKQALDRVKKQLYQQTENTPVPTDQIASKIESIVFGQEASLIKKEEDQDKLDARKPFPFIYGFIGLMFVVLVYTSISGTNGDISTEQFGVWLIIFFALRFMGAAAQSMRNALFSLFSNYKYVRRINLLLSKA